jgi:hypothetical protein
MRTRCPWCADVIRPQEKKTIIENEMYHVYCAVKYRRWDANQEAAKYEEYKEAVKENYTKT